MDGSENFATVGRNSV